MWVLDPKTKKKSVSLTLLVLTTLVGLGLLVASVMKADTKNFTAADVATLTTPFAGLYFGRKWSDKDKKDSDSSQA